MEFVFRQEVKDAQKAAMGEMYNLAKEHLKPGDKLINFASGHPSTEVFPESFIKRYVDKALVEGQKDLLQYGPHMGYAPLREEFKMFANTKGTVVKEQDELMVTYGNVEGIFLTAYSLLNAGERVIVEEPSYVNAIKAFELQGAEIVSVSQEADGVNLNELEKEMQRGAKIYYTISNFSNPSGITMSAEKRMTVYELAVKYNVVIIEDNAYGDLRYRGQRIPNIKEYDKTGNVVYLCSMSKLIAPAMRVGFMVADKKFIKKVATIKAVSTNGVTQIVQSALYLMFKENDMYGEIQKICKLYSEKLLLAEKCMNMYFPKNVKFSVPDGGMYIWITMPEGTEIQKFCRDCAIQLHIPITPGNGFCAKGHADCTSMRLNFVKESLEDIEYGIRTMGEFMKGY